MTGLFYDEDVAQRITVEGRNLLTYSASIACFNAEEEWSEENVKDMIVAIVDMLKAVDDDLDAHTHVGNRDNIKVSFIKSGFARCAPFIGLLEFGPRLYLNDLTADSFGYVRERPYIRKRCKTKTQHLIWLILHEYCHLYKNRMNHNKAFYEFIDEKFVKFFSKF